MSNEVKIGSVVGTGAAINVSLGFVPDMVEVYNVTDGDTEHVWFRSAGAALTIKLTGALATQAANGISEYAGDSTHAAGFTLGTDVSENLKTLCYRATRNAEGN